MCDVVVLDDEYRIIREYQNKTQSRSSKKVGDVFLKWLLRNQGNTHHVETVHIIETNSDHFEEFPDRVYSPVSTLLTVSFQLLPIAI